MDQGSARKSQMNHPHKSQSAAMDRAGELPDCEQLRECINSGQVSAAQVAPHPGTPIKEYIAKVRANPERAAAMDATKEKLSSADKTAAGMSQDDSKQLSNALSRAPNARALVREAAELIAELQKAAEQIAQEHYGWGNTCLDAAAALAAKQEEVARLTKALERIKNLDPMMDSEEGFNEWGEADCFSQAQEIAKAALNPNQGEK